MTSQEKIAIVSGYFNPMHIGHLRLIQGAKDIAPYVVTIVNNDTQQLLKKGKIILPEEDRMEIVAELRSVDHAVLSVDQDGTVVQSLHLVRSLYPDAEMAFCNGGDRSDVADLPSREAQVCAELSIEMHYGVGGTDKLDSSTRITSAYQG